MRGLMEFITARTDTETGSIRYTCDMEKIRWMTIKAMKYIQRAGASHTGECTPVCLFLFK